MPTIEYLLSDIRKTTTARLLAIHTVGEKMIHKARTEGARILVLSFCFLYSASAAAEPTVCGLRRTRDGTGRDGRYSEEKAGRGSWGRARRATAAKSMNCMLLSRRGVSVLLEVKDRRFLPQHAVSGGRRGLERTRAMRLLVHGLGAKFLMDPSIHPSIYLSMNTTGLAQSGLPDLNHPWSQAKHEVGGVPACWFPAARHNVAFASQALPG
ncbi:hypothetical protein AXG93_2318s1320 [Marchantia polymorpha subsp. ruderalis]|uniref:Uncharacterized protein n=1 Tax=Marchantia polymorpha subsp. ruderalis TaxID=1480154 RepID=A0A176VQY5_MARPO|nr:hypothetical protein AXG93_2318s1320 [Marchantia polymorpha subsp. ruderalis]